MTTEQITLKTNFGGEFKDLVKKVSRYSEVILLTTAFFRNNDNQWQTSITIETNNETI